MPDLPPFATIALRLLVIGGGLGAWFVTQRLISSRPADKPGIDDQLHRLTRGANDWLRRNPRAANVLLICSSLGVDAIALFVLGYAILGTSFTPFWGLLCLFAMRQACHAIIVLPAPPGIIWRDPGFPSLFVTNTVGNDFFFSGHTALAVYGAIQLATLGIPMLTGLGILTAILQMVLVIILLAHWTLNVVAGLFAAVMVGALSWTG
jgi:hypothetical protein